jgi:hypothetical protein
MTRDERIIAYVDGELDAADRDAFEAEMAADPHLAAEVALHQSLAARVGDAYASVLDEPVPPLLLAMAAAANDVNGSRARFGPPAWAAMAACLVVGVVAGRAVWPPPAPLVARDGVLVARGELAHSLSRQLAADPGVVRVGLSFRAADGRFCRTFQSVREGLAGLACRQRERWIAEIATAYRPGPTPDYRTAASETPPAILATVDRLIAGAPLDAAQERAARDRGWR